MDNKKIILNTLVKGAISGVLAGALEHQFGRFSSTVSGASGIDFYGLPTAVKFGLGVFVATTSSGYAEYELKKKPQPQLYSFLESRIIESTTSVGVCYMIDPTTWKSDRGQVINNVYHAIKYSNFIQRIGVIVLSDFVAGLVSGAVIDNIPDTKY